MKKMSKLTGLLAVFTSALLLSGCDFKVLEPVGYVAHEQRLLIIICVAVMLCVVIPVMVAVVLFAIKYRSTNSKAEYLPDWAHSNRLESVMWGIPILIVTVLAILTGIYTWKLEPSKLLPENVVGKAKPLQIDAVALDWKWLFIYPEYGIATINEIYAPEGRQVFLQLTSEESVNAFWVPKIGTVLYAMPQMNSKLHAFADAQGIFDGMSANYSGDGFSDMRFKWHSVAENDFNAWVAKIRNGHSSSGNKTLDRSSYLRLAIAPKMGDVAAKEKDAQVRYFSNVEKGLYYRIVNRCVIDGTTCNEDQMKLAAAQTLWGELCSVFDPGFVTRKAE